MATLVSYSFAHILDRVAIFGGSAGAASNS